MYSELGITPMAVIHACMDNIQIFKVFGILFILSCFIGFAKFFGEFAFETLLALSGSKVHKKLAGIVKKLLCISTILCIFSMPVFAADNTSLNAGEQMIKGGIDSWIVGQADQMMEGVHTGNVSNMSEATPSQRLITSIATYEIHPYKVGWVRDEAKTDYTIMILCGIIILIFCAIAHYAQIIWPEECGAFAEMIYGEERWFNYSTYVKTLGKLIIIPIMLPFVLTYSIDLEQAISQGIMLDSLQYIALSTKNIPLYLMQGFSYLFCSWFVTFRIIIINQVCAKVFLVALLLCIPWDIIKSIGKIVLLYFYTALFMRPVMLMITGMAVKQVYSMPTQEALTSGVEIYAISIAIVALVCVVATFWPLLYALLKLITSKIGRFFVRNMRKANGM